jgi:phosphate starvation-inducible PhoH-like protein
LATKKTIVLNDNIINELCGVNDQNIKVFEDLLGINVFSRGNELFLETEDETIWRKFKKMIVLLEDQVKLGQLPCPDLLRTLYNTVNNGDSRKADLLKSSHIIIPRVGKKVFPRSYNQAVYLDAIKNKDMVFGIGPAGTGKTFLALAYALKAILAKERAKLILTRPVVEAGENLGYLPGDLEQKISPYLRPLYDAMEKVIPKEMIRDLEENRIIEVAPLAYMRGRTLADAFIILDEAQNTSKEQMKMFLTRMGEGSQVVITGDITQIDLPKKNESGLLHVIPILKPIEEIQFVFLDNQDVVRNPLVKKIVHAYENQKES